MRAEKVVCCSRNASASSAELEQEGKLATEMQLKPQMRWRTEGYKKGSTTLSTRLHYLSPFQTPSFSTSTPRSTVAETLVPSSSSTIQSGLDPFAGGGRCITKEGMAVNPGVPVETWGRILGSSREVRA